MSEFSFLEVSGPFWAFLGAALASILGGIGSAIGSGVAGEAASGLSSEKPELAMKAIILQALPGSQVIYGFVVVFFILFIVMSGGEEITPTIGLQIFAASIPVGATGLFSAIYQGKVLAGGMNMLAKSESNFAKAMIMGAIIETVAIVGLLGSILMLLQI